MRASLLALIVVPIAGCSLLFTNGPPDNHERLPYFTCTDSNLWPAVDLALAALFGVSVAVNAGQSDQYFEDRNTTKGATIGVGLAFTALAGVSSIVGFGRVGRCSSAREKWALRQQGNPPPYPQGYPPPGYPPQGYPPQGYPPPPQGYPPQGYPPPPQGYPPPQTYPPSPSPPQPYPPPPTPQ